MTVSRNLYITIMQVPRTAATSKEGHSNTRTNTISGSRPAKAREAHSSSARLVGPTKARGTTMADNGKKTTKFRSHTASPIEQHMTIEESRERERILQKTCQNLRIQLMPSLRR